MSLSLAIIIQGRLSTLVYLITSLISYLLVDGSKKILVLTLDSPSFFLELSRYMKCFYLFIYFIFSQMIRVTKHCWLLSKETEQWKIFLNEEVNKDQAFLSYLSKSTGVECKTMEDINRIKDNLNVVVSTSNE